MTQRRAPQTPTFRLPVSGLNGLPACAKGTELLNHRWVKEERGKLKACGVASGVLWEEIK